MQVREAAESVALKKAVLRRGRQARDWVLADEGVRNAAELAELVLPDWVLRIFQSGDQGNAPDFRSASSPATAEQPARRQSYTGSLTAADIATQQPRRWSASAAAVEQPTPTVLAQASQEAQTPGSRLVSVNGGILRADLRSRLRHSISNLDAMKGNLR